MGVEAGAQGELKCLASDGLRGAVHDEIAPGETLVEVILLQVQPEGGGDTDLQSLKLSGFTNTSLRQKQHL